MIHSPLLRKTADDQLLSKRSPFHLTEEFLKGVLILLGNPTSGFVKAAIFYIDSQRIESARVEYLSPKTILEAHIYPLLREGIQIGFSEPEKTREELTLLNCKYYDTEKRPVAIPPTLRPKLELRFRERPKNQKPTKTSTCKHPDCAHQGQPFCPAHKSPCILENCLNRTPVFGFCSKHRFRCLCDSCHKRISEDGYCVEHKLSCLEIGCRNRSKRDYCSLHHGPKRRAAKREDIVTNLNDPPVYVVLGQVDMTRTARESETRLERSDVKRLERSERTESERVPSTARSEKASAERSEQPVYTDLDQEDFYNQEVYVMLDQGNKI